MPIEHGANVRQRTLLGLALVLLCFNGAALLAFLTGSLEQRQEQHRDFRYKALPVAAEHK